MHKQARELAGVSPLRAQRRGPKSKVSAADLLMAIRADLKASPFTGEGHRKVWARLRILSNRRVSRARVLRLIREHQLLSPHRRPQGAPSLHEGTITTNRPNEMWGTDVIRIDTVDEGWVWGARLSIISTPTALASMRSRSATALPLAADCPGPESASSRGCRDRQAAALPARAWLPRDPGLLFQPPAAGGAIPRAAAA